jgi:glycine cleavage system H protein
MTSRSDNMPEDLRYSPEHQWIKLEEDGIGRIGITAYAEDELGEIIYVSLPKVGQTVAFNEKLGEVESIKVASEFYSPASGEVIEVNKAVDETPELVNKDPYGEGWLVLLRLGDPSDLDRLLPADGYRALIRKEQGG